MVLTTTLTPTGNLKQGKVMVSIPARWKMSPAYMHSLTMTENYIVLIEQPLAVSLSELLSDILTNAPFIAGLKWHDEPVSAKISTIPTHAITSENLWKKMIAMYKR